MGVGTRHCRVLYIIPMQPETISGAQWNNQFGVSIPSRGSGKGDLNRSIFPGDVAQVFQSPLGEVVKETPLLKRFQILLISRFQSPLGEVVKETPIFVTTNTQGMNMFQSPLGEVVKETRH